MRRKHVAWCTLHTEAAVHNPVGVYHSIHRRGRQAGRRATMIHPSPIHRQAKQAPKRTRTTHLEVKTVMTSGWSLIPPRFCRSKRARSAAVVAAPEPLGRVCVCVFVARGGEGRSDDGRARAWRSACLQEDKERREGRRRVQQARRSVPQPGEAVGQEGQRRDLLHPAVLPLLVFALLVPTAYAHTRPQERNEKRKDWSSLGLASRGPYTPRRVFCGRSGRGHFFQPHDDQPGLGLVQRLAPALSCGHPSVSDDDDAGLSE